MTSSGISPFWILNTRMTLFVFDAFWAWCKSITFFSIFEMHFLKPIAFKYQNVIFSRKYNCGQPSLGAFEKNHLLKMSIFHYLVANRKTTCPYNFLTSRLHFFKKKHFFDQKSHIYIRGWKRQDRPEPMWNDRFSSKINNIATANVALVTFAHDGFGKHPAREFPMSNRTFQIRYYFRCQIQKKAAPTPYCVKE